MREQLGFGGYKTMIRGKARKLSAWLGGPKEEDWARCAKLCELGYPKVDRVKRIPGMKTFFWNDWIPGEDLWKLRGEWTTDMFFLWGKETGKIHNLGLSAWDLFPKNYVYDGKRVWFIDYKKLYTSNFPEYDVLKDITFNRGIPDEMKMAFTEGYKTERDFSDKHLLSKIINHCYDNYQRIEVNGCIIKSGARSSKRLTMIRDEDFKDKTVLDIGCSEGMFARYTARNGAKKVVGVDMQTRNKRYRVTTLAAFLAMLEGTQDKIYFQHIDIESLTFIGQKGKYDVVFFCAILGHLKKKRDEYMKFLEGLTNKVLYYESNLGGIRKPTEEWLRKTTSFRKIEYLGNSGDEEAKHNYAFFRCEK